MKIKNVVALVLAALMLISCFAGIVLIFDAGAEEFEIPVISGEKYSFMNCDTGRFLSAFGEKEFTVEALEGKNMYALKSKRGVYLDFTGDTPKYAEAPVPVTLCLENPYERVQIRISDKLQLMDSDLGSSNLATVMTTSTDANILATGWYLTKSGDALPLRYAVLGDSITEGVNPDETGRKDGCRKYLSENMLTKYKRVVSVGSVAKDVTMITDGYMLRHEGHSGWVVQAQEEYARAPQNNHGIDTLRDTLQNKYVPDVIFMMIGINDCGLLGYGNIYEDNDGVRTALVERWTTLVRDIIYDLPEGGHLVVASCTPLATGGVSWNDNYNTYITPYNRAIWDAVRKFNKQGENRISFADNYTYVHVVSPDCLSSDGLHLSAKGYEVMAQSYFDAYAKLKAVKGDVDGDGELTARDAVAIVKYTFDPIENRIDTALGDVDGDGKVNASDAVYIVYHIFFPEMFPLG